MTKHRLGTSCVRLLTIWIATGLLGSAFAAQAQVRGMQPRSGPPVRPGDFLAVEARLLEAYNAAVADAAVFDSRQIVSELSAISADMTFGSWHECASLDWAKAAIGESIALERELWVTISSEMTAACAGFARNHEPLALRIQQLLGLPPVLTETPRDTCFVNVQLADLSGIFRPCTNPDPMSTIACAGEATPPGSGASFPWWTSTGYLEWYTNQKLSSYQVTQEAGTPEAPLTTVGYPFTGLGYTYNWKPGGDFVGLAEFVIPAGATVTVNAVVTTEESCAP